ncbi:hypothetical protein D0T85_22430, partial [Bacteroides sp. 519]|nr:hypothetical protein [Bacteroides sp. 519]
DPDYSRKLKTDLFIDDRNIGGVPDWGLIYQMIINPDIKNIFDFKFEDFELVNYEPHRRAVHTKGALPAGRASECGRTMWKATWLESVSMYCDGISMG